ncbi:hypothetical protein GGF46_001105 [Coemansia sp. RSA 552]|nr:hypothetical protein GGF46_001105 [Coemansia sp. RSA 552]
MPTCTRNGCGQSFEEAGNDPLACQYHPGKPEFHEGRKGWTCCKPRVHSFDDFLEIGGCKLGLHSSEPKHKDDPFKADLTQFDDVLPEPPRTEPTAEAVAPAKSAAKLPEPGPVDEDPAGVEVAQGTHCKRSGCDAVYKSEEQSRGPDQCQFHPGTALFHEGNKGWTCCKPRVTDFDEFMRIKGCAHGRHLFVGSQPAKQAQAPKCRRDHYESGNDLIVSIYAKKISAGASSITFGPDTLHVHLVYGDGQVYDDAIRLHGRIDPGASSLEYLSTKVEITLAKAAAGKWPALEKDGDM